MAKIKRKGEAGAARNYVTRNQAVRRLQLSLPDFRRLCIWKGIYPREPRDRKKVSKSSTPSTTFYYAKDIQFLQHEPLLLKFRQRKVLERKIKRALGRGDFADANRLEGDAGRPEKTGRPRYTLDHVVRERYPTFADALRDLDDCLSTLFLFANLPATADVPAKMIARCDRLCLEFQHYIIVSRSLRKSFLSIKGIYYLATLQGEDVMWLVPYRFNQRIVVDVDFRIMATFVEFYMTTLSFINFRLYASVGLKYPPSFDQAKDDRSAELAAFTLEGRAAAAAAGGPQPGRITENGEPAPASRHGPNPAVQAAVNKVIAELGREPDEAEVPSGPAGALVPVPGDGDEDGDERQDEGERESGALDKFEPVAPGGDMLPQPTAGNPNMASLFASCTFYLSRETPRQPLEFILRAFGCNRIGWDRVLGEGAYTTNEHDPRITHHVIDRPAPVVMPPGGDQAEEEDEQAGDNQTIQKLAPNVRIPGRVYVQPQWVWDSVNDEELKPAHLYGPGTQLPPHLSPFVKSVQGQYDPALPLEEQESEGEALEAELDGQADSDDDEPADHDGDDDHAAEALEFGEPVEVGERDASAESEFGGFSGEEEEEDGEEEDDDGEEEEEDGEEEEEDAEKEAGDLYDSEADHAAAQRQRELEAELAGASVKPVVADPQRQAKLDKRRDLARKAQDEADEIERAKGMMSKKKRKLFERMTYSNNKKSAEAKTLRAKRRRIERSG